MNKPWWAFVRYVNKLKGPGVAKTNGPVITIPNKYKNDVGVFFHELEHVKQWYKTFGFHSLLYLLSKKYRYWSEVQAYKQQCKYGLDERDAARSICKYYKLNVDYDETLNDLKS